jgi:hypothetical protein
MNHHCELCNLDFTTISNLRKHERTAKHVAKGTPMNNDELLARITLLENENNILKEKNEMLEKEVIHKQKTIESIVEVVNKISKMKSEPDQIVFEVESIESIEVESIESIVESIESIEVEPIVEKIESIESICSEFPMEPYKSEIETVTKTKKQRQKKEEQIETVSETKKQLQDRIKKEQLEEIEREEQEKEKNFKEFLKNREEQEKEYQKRKPSSCTFNSMVER